ncbi:ABC transporter substrate-binding protein [Sporosarcina sp. FSL K6-3457]|uniref:ABC transporter substrate-binding protein n=1 Tax=Sporosarcina sp. FSL K6-3457 TaxID=2978204 RepID=UPI0030FAF689
MKRIYKKLRQARPDAIIGTDQVCPSEKKKINRIAPSFFVPAEHISWKEQLKMVARFLEREDRAEQWIERYEFKVQSAREQIGSALGDDKILVVRIHGQNIHMYWNRGLEDVLYQDLKLEAVYRGNEPSNIEQLTKLDPDRILLVVCPEALSRAYWLALQHSVEWRQLKAVRSRKTYHILSDPWFEYSAVSIIRMLDEALLLFTGNCPNAFLENVHGEL